MKAPSHLCLQTLRLIAFPNFTTTTTTTEPLCLRLSQQQQQQRRCFASQPPPPPKPFKNSSSQLLPKPASRQTPPSSFQNRKQNDKNEKDDTEEDEHLPRPLTSPLGLPFPPSPGQNTGLDHRSLRKRRDDFVDYDKHLVKREKMTRQISKPYFRDWSNLRYHKGKVFIAPERLFRQGVALWFPNFFGRILRKLKRGERGRGGGGGLGRKDGYGGRGRDTCEVLVGRGRVSIVGVVSNAWAVDQVNSFIGEKENPALHALINTPSQPSNSNATGHTPQAPIIQQVEINLTPNPLKYLILLLFGLPSLRRSRSLAQQSRYFIVRRGVSEEMKQALAIGNEQAGYVYLVDQEGKVRWAGSAVATEAERESLVRGVSRMVQEVTGPAKLRDAVKSVVEEDGEKGAAAAG